MMRRKTTLPEPAPVLHGFRAAFTKAMKDDFLGPIRAEMNRQSYGNTFSIPTTDGWDEAVKWIERSEAAKAEWPWPARR